MLRLLFFLFIAIPITANGQRNGAPGAANSITGSIAGILMDSVTRTPIEYAAIGILDDVSGKVVNGGLSDDRGAFRISELPLQKYRVQISFIGYTAKVIHNVALTPQKPDFDCGLVLLAPESQLLEEVKVLGEAALIEAKPDKIIYNAERDVTSAGGDASDVLRKVPLLTVDLDGNVSLRGSENVKILINGRPSGMFSNNVADALKMMPADQIKSVEVITSPSAKYDGEGTAGIINIITRKKNIEGLAGSIDLTAGTRHHRANGNLNYGKGRLGINISGGGHYSRPQTGETTFRREESIDATNSLLTQDGVSESSRLGFRTNAGLEYNINAFNAISSSFSYRGHDNKSINKVSSLYEVDSEIIDTYERLVDGKTSRTGWDWETDYKLNFPDKEKEWSIAVEIDHDDDNSDFAYDQDYIIPAGLQSNVESNLNEGDNTEITLQTDYTHPFSERVKLETGLKGTLREIKSDFRFNTYDPDLNEWIADPGRTDIFHYNQNVYAGYGSASMQLGKKINLIAGVRLEITGLKGEFEFFDNPFRNEYINVLPSVTLAKKTGQFNMIKVSYNQRIQRPNQRHINPFIEYNDNRDISYGNPSLFPELVHQVEAGSTFLIKGSMFNITVFGRRTEDLIENLLTINEEGISESTYYNFGRRTAIGTNVFGSVNIGEKFSVRGGFDVNAWQSEGEFEDESLTNTGFDYNGRINLTWSISETLKMEGFSFFRSPVTTVQGKNPSWSMMSFGIKKELFKKRLSLGVNFTEPFRENIAFVREIEGEDFYQYSRSLRPMRSIGVNIGYRFGKLDFKERTGKKKVNNNDLKEEEGIDNNF